MLFLVFLALLLVPSVNLHAQASRTLDIYFIDVEGGAATLLVSPSGESFLIDTGWTVGDRDAKRIYAATQLAGVKKIDHLLISHWHADHVGGLAALSKMIQSAISTITATPSSRKISNGSIAIQLPQTVTELS